MLVFAQTHCYNVLQRSDGHISSHQNLGTEEQNVVKFVPSDLQHVKSLMLNQHLTKLIDSLSH